jgi:circadian clock protein KaiC
MRSKHLGFPLDEHIAAGRIELKQADPAELAPDEFTSLVRSAVEERGARVVVIDSLSGFFNALPEARHLALLMHELLGYLSERGVASLVTVAHAGVLGQMATTIDMSYLADTIVLVRYFEDGGRLRKAISVVKKRSGRHEDSIRELTLGADGIRVGETLASYRGILTGVPTMRSPDGDGRV